MIESPEQVIGDSLDIEFAEASEDAFAFFGDSITISILQPPQVGGGCDEDTVLPDGDACGP